MTNVPYSDKKPGRAGQIAGRIAFSWQKIHTWTTAVDGCWKGPQFTYTWADVSAAFEMSNASFLTSWAYHSTYTMTSYAHAYGSCRFELPMNTSMFTELGPSCHDHGSPTDDTGYAANTICPTSLNENIQALQTLTWAEKCCQFPWITNTAYLGEHRPHSICQRRSECQ